MHPRTTGLTTEYVLFADPTGRMARMSHESIFSYSISRPFPFRWFTPIAVVGGVIFIALFTFLNFVSSSYELVVQNSLNPNKTIHERELHDWPSFLTRKVRSTCQPTDLLASSQFSTNQTALAYTLTDIWQETDNDRIVYPSLTYYNNVLEQCSIASVEVNLAQLDRSGLQLAFGEYGIVLRSFVTCQIGTPTGIVMFNLTQTYDYIPDTASFEDLWTFLGTGFQSRNQTTRASLWWGESLMSTYWGSASAQMEEDHHNRTSFNEPGIYKGTVSFTSNRSYTDMQDLNFFNADYRYIVDNGNSEYDVLCCPDIPGPLTAASLTEADIKPNIWTTLDTLAKAAYSTILTDLGQDKRETTIVTNETLLAHFTTNFTSSYSRIPKGNYNPGPATQNYTTLKDTTGPLGTTPSVISTPYICQVPRLKSSGNIFVAILVADLVLLQAVWQIYKYLAETYLTNQRPSAQVCQGCLRALDDERPSSSSVLVIRNENAGEDHPLVDMPKTAGKRNTREWAYDGDQHN